MEIELVQGKEDMDTDSTCTTCSGAHGVEQARDEFDEAGGAILVLT